MRRLMSYELLVRHVANRPHGAGGRIAKGNRSAALDQHRVSGAVPWINFFSSANVNSVG